MMRHTAVITLRGNAPRVVNGCIANFSNLRVCCQVEKSGSLAHHGSTQEGTSAVHNSSTWNEDSSGNKLQRLHPCLHSTLPHSSERVLHGQYNWDSYRHSVFQKTRVNLTRICSHFSPPGNSFYRSENKRMAEETCRRRTGISFGSLAPNKNYQQKLDQQHARGKLSASERVEVLLDSGSFTEVGSYVKHRSSSFGLDPESAPRGDGVITGIGRLAHVQKLIINIYN